VVDLLLVAGSVLAMPPPVPPVSSVLNRVLTSGGLLVAILVVVGLVMPTLRGRRPGRGWPVGWPLAAGAAVTAAGSGCAALLVRVVPWVQQDPGGQWLFGGLVAETGVVLALCELRARGRHPQGPSVPGVRPCGQSWRVAWRPWRRPSS